MRSHAQAIPAWQLYGEAGPFPDVLHIERIVDRASGLDWTIAPHRHLQLHQLFLFLGGDIRLSADGAPLPVTPPALVNVPRGVVHEFTFSAGTDGYVLTLPASDFPELFGPAAEPAAAAGNLFVVTPAAELIAAFGHLADGYGRPGKLRRSRMRAQAALILCAALDLHDAGAAGGDGPDADVRMRAFAGLVAETLRERRSIEAYAGSLGLSARQLRRLCLKATGLTPQGFVEQQLVREACRMLAYTRESVQGVGFSLGFDDPAYFSRFFQRGTGLAPSAYRARLDGPWSGADSRPSGLPRAAE